MSMTDEDAIKLSYAIFLDEDSASHAVDKLLEGPFVMDEITVLTRSVDADEIEQLPIEGHTRTRKIGTVGAGVGAVIGSVGLAIAGPWLGAGALLLALQGALAGGATGGALGVLAGLNWEDYEIDFDAEHFPPDAFLVGVLSRHRTDEARGLLQKAGATEVFTRTPGAAFEAFSHPNYVAPPNRVAEAGEESFPASDPPSWNPPGD